MEVVDLGTSDFDTLKNSVVFEDIVIGRKGAILVQIEEKGEVGDIPVVRSTTLYKNGVQRVSDIHKALCPVNFNNSMIELYTDKYTTMKYHSDLAIDLVPGTKICIYSSYPQSEKRRRKLMIKNKVTGEISEIELKDGHVVMFDTETNKKFLHKIVGSSDWLGITYRTSKTYAKNLRMATDSEKKEFFRLRGKENNNVDFEWEELPYTINSGDLLPIQEVQLSEPSDHPDSK